MPAKPGYFIPVPASAACSHKCATRRATMKWAFAMTCKAFKPSCAPSG